MTNPCWDSRTDSIPEKTHHFDEGQHYQQTKGKPIRATPKPDKASVDYDRIWRSGKNGYKAFSDMVIGRWKDGLDYMRTAELACQWLAIFNQLNNIPERIYSLRELQRMSYIKECV